MRSHAPVDSQCELWFTSLSAWGACGVCDGRAEQLPCPLCVPRHVETALGQVPQDAGGHDDPEEHHRDRLRVEVWADSALRLPEPDDLDNFARVAGEYLQDTLSALRVPGVNVVGEDHPGDGPTLRG